MKIKLYLGGVAGDEPDVQRKIRAGQFHGGVFTGKALGDIYGDIRMMEVPFNFVNDRKKAVQVLGAMRPHFDEGFRKNGFESLAYYEIGKAYIVSKKKSTSLENLKGSKIWAWEGDKLVEATLKNLRLVSVPLALPDVLTSLSTGMIDSAYNSPLGVIALQWQSKIAYLVDNMPINYAFGAFLLSKRAWSKISKKDQATIKQVMQGHEKVTNDTTIAENKKALETMKSMGIEFIKYPSSDMQKGKEVRRKVIGELTGNLFSAKGVELFRKQMSSSH